MDFIAVIERALKCEPGSHCALYGFLMDYIKDVFLGQIRTDNSDALNEASHLLDSWKALNDIDVLREHGMKKPLLQSTAVIKKCIDVMHVYMQTLPLYCEHFLTMMCTTVMQYKEICLAAYRGLVQPESEDKRIISAQWAKDEDINRFLRSLPNWLNIRDSSGTIESPEAVEQRNIKEAQVLKGNMGAAKISDHEILYDMGQLKSLGQLQESLEWFSASIVRLSERFLQSNMKSGIGGLPKLSNNSIQTLMSLAKEFEDIADTCLLVLHIEVSSRLLCTYIASCFNEFPFRFVCTASTTSIPSATARRGLTFPAARIQPIRTPR
jgi:exocyst complex component 4